MVNSIPLAPPPELLLVCGIEGAPLRYRAHHVAEAHRLLGGTAECIHYRDPDVINRVTRAGLVIFYRVPWSDWVRRCLREARGAGVMVAFSVDDLVFDPSLRNRIPAIKMLSRHEGELWMDGVRRYQATARACGLFIGSTPTLVRAAETQGLRAVMHPNGMGSEEVLLCEEALLEALKSRTDRRELGTCRVGYLSGSTTHDRDWAMIEPAVASILARFPAVELWLLGPVKLRKLDENHPRLRRIPFRPFQDLPRLAAELDIVLAPLEPDLEFSEAKSAVKWLEAAPLGLPVIASPTGPFRAVIEHQKTGLLALPNEWEAAIEMLVLDTDAREQIGRAAMLAVHRDYGPEASARRWQETLQHIARMGAEQPLPNLTPGALELASPAALEPEAPGAYLDQPSVPRETIVDRLGGARILGCALTPAYSRLCRVDVYTALARLAEPAAPLALELRSAEGRLVRSTELPHRALAEDAWTAWAFEPIPESAGQRFDLLLSQPSAGRGRGIACWSSLDVGSRAVDGRDVTGALCVRAFSQPSRQEICSVALRRTAPVPHQPRHHTWRQMRLRYHGGRIVYHKGRVSVRTIGVLPTAARVAQYLGRSFVATLRRR